MKNEDFRTLAYNKSPKTSKRTTFQVNNSIFQRQININQSGVWMC